MRRILFLVLPLLALAARPAPGTCGPLINEVMADPAGDWDGDGAYSYKSDEWIEVVNPGPGELDLAGYFLADADGGRVYGFTGTLAAGAVAVVYGSAAAAWEAANGESTTGLRLGNDGGIVQLVQVADGALIVVDTVSYNNHEAEDDRSSGRLPDASSTWVLFDSLFPYTGTLTPTGTGMPPTPGARNDGVPVDPPPTPSQETTWGAVKSLYALS